MKGKILKLNFNENCEGFIVPLCKILHKEHKTEFCHKRNCIISHLNCGGNVRINFPKKYDNSDTTIIVDDKGAEYLDKLYVQRIIKKS